MSDLKLGNLVMNAQRISMAVLVVVSIVATTSEKNITSAQQNPILARLTQNSLSLTNRRFITEAAQGGRAEVDLGRLASQRGLNREVKQYGQRMVLDHTQANNELKELTNQKGINLPPGIGQENSTVKVRLSKLYGAAFDEAYMNQMVADHNQDVSLFERQSQRGDDRDLRDWVAKTLPNIQEHLRLANSITGHLGDKNRL